MPVSERLPRRFGSYILGGSGRGCARRSPRLADRAGTRIRPAADPRSPEIPEDAVLDAIEENGEIHSFLKNPAIARGVQMDSVEGVPFLAWDEENGRTLDSLLARAPSLQGASRSSTRC
jgi:hypothetical protein